jgi:transcriptional regulator with PAS, ATPase and Fis domain
MERLTLEVSEELLNAVGSVLDIRQVFPEVSAIVQSLLPHDRLTMTLHDGRRTLIAYAFSNDDGPFLVRASSPDFEAMGDVRAKIIHDLMAEESTATFDPPDYRERAKAAGYRSILSVPVRAREQLFALHFWSRRAAAFSEADVALARHVAVHVALGVSHEQLAEAARRTAAARARTGRLEARVQALSAELQTRTGYGRMAGESAAWKNVVRAATQVAETDTTVLLTGESGTGKEVIARYIHRASARRHGPFAAVNCAALPETLLESELFGHERGAFTGADQRHAGQIEAAAGGVLLLDEVSEMSPTAQVKFLRVLQEREFQRLGGTKPIKADVRIIAAGNRDLDVAMDRGTFREDLYYRLRVFEIRIPPLRERPEDILPLTAAFLDDIGRSFGRAPAGLTREAREVLLTHAWRGNTRELRNVLERAAIVSEGALITPEHLALDLSHRSPESPATDVKTMERRLIERVLKETKGNKSRAAKRLGLTRKQLYGRLALYRIA